MGTEAGWCLLLCLALWGEAVPTDRLWRPVDVIFDCLLAKEGGPRAGFTSSEDRAKAVLVLRQVPVLDDGSLEGFTDFQGDQLSKDDPPVTFEASVDLVQIPQAGDLLHAECNEKQVTCEFSRYFLQAGPETAVDTAAYFLASVQVSEGGPSISMVMRTLGEVDKGNAWHPTLNLPLSPQGTVKTAVQFQITTQTPTLTSPLGSSVSLHCGFSKAPDQALLSVEWRLQHQGHGRLVYRWIRGQRRVERPGATLEPEPLLEAGDASLSLPDLVVGDEGTYICQVTTSQYQAQQIAQLHIRASPKVRLNQETKSLPPTLTCHVTGYYPLDVAITWTREEPGSPPAPVPEASFSSLRQSAAGTYSISSSLTADPGPAGAMYTCQVTHVSLEEPLRASTWVAPPEQRTIFGALFASCLFVLTLWLLVLQRRQATSPRSAKTLRASG
ncbi:tapasin-related protein isoform X1 [Sorex fumeus]|uniref:tapasin-related protein isoform X1 n=1 Tax=Sorex fumeus TaxID=62283 RepID=UPI0024ACA820|nr:tapasin-related protein isoform X1 [Sorex fumeus]